jgi:hypothetical protein
VTSSIYLLRYQSFNKVNCACTVTTGRVEQHTQRIELTEINDGRRKKKKPVCKNYLLGEMGGVLEGVPQACDLKAEAL